MNRSAVRTVAAPRGPGTGTSPGDAGVQYDPWRVLATQWPDVDLCFEHLPGDLLGQIRSGGRLIVVRTDSSAAQRRCTLAHELVHLERGFATGHAYFDGREELAVHRIAAGRLIGFERLLDVVREADDHRTIAAALDVDRHTLAVRLATLSAGQLVQLGAIARRRAA